MKKRRRISRTGTETERPQGGHRWRWSAWGGTCPHPEENADLPEFTPERAHLLLQRVYGDFLHHNDGLHLDRGIADNALWQRCWRRLVEQLASWYDTPSGAVGRRFTAILAS